MIPTKRKKPLKTNRIRRAWILTRSFRRELKEKKILREVILLSRTWLRSINTVTKNTITPTNHTRVRRNPTTTASTTTLRVSINQNGKVTRSSHLFSQSLRHKTKMITQLMEKMILSLSRMRPKPRRCRPSLKGRRNHLR